MFGFFDNTRELKAQNTQIEILSQQVNILFQLFKNHLAMQEVYQALYQKEVEKFPPKDSCESTANEIAPAVPSDQELGVH